MAYRYLGEDRSGRDRWEVSWRVGGRERIKTVYSEREAKRLDKRIRAQRTLGQLTDSAGGRQRFERWARQFEKDRALSIRGENTKLRNAYLFEKHVIPWFGNRELTSINRHLVQSWIHEMWRDGEGLSADTVRRTYQIFHRIMEAAVEDFDLKDPCRRVWLPPTERKDPDALTLEQVYALASAFDTFEPRYRLYPLLGAFTGLRPGELAAVRVADFDFLRTIPTLTVGQELIDAGGYLRFKSVQLKTRASKATINLPPAFVAEEVAGHIRDFVLGRPTIEGYKPANVTGLLFVGGPPDRPSPVRPNNFRNRQWARAVKIASQGPAGPLPAFCAPNILRHTYSTLLADLAQHPTAIQQQMRHRDSRVAMDHYIKRNPAMGEGAAAALDGLYRTFLAQKRGVDAEPTAEGGRMGSIE
jgi:integrase